ncbi:MAG: hypothetical protein U9R06_03780, partial [Patescibacteria group bacterium]|nr:hypothetical protein [Patescibacteria group bacterium]
DSEVLNYLSDKAMLKDFSGEVRKQQWRETWTMLSKDYCWLIGSGLSGYQTAIQAYHQEGIFFNFSRDTEFRTKIVWFDEEYKAKHWRPVEIYMYPHNILLNFWVELGLAGALLFVWIIGKFFYLGIRNYELKIKNNKNKDYLILGIVGAMIVIIVHGIVDVPYFKNDLAIMFWAMLALIGTMHLKIKDESK